MDDTVLLQPFAGTFVSPSQALFAGMNLLEATAVDELQCPEIPEHYENRAPTAALGPCFENLPAAHHRNRTGS